MGRITSSVGLISGLNTGNIIDQLIAADSGPLNNLKSKLTTDNNQKQALLGFSAQLLALQASSSSLKSPTVLNARTANSSDSSLSVSADSTAQLGSYQFQVLQLAQNQRVVSSGYASTTSSVGTGNIVIKQGGAVSTNPALSTLNGGQGVRLGVIRITDRSGASVNVDLSAAQTLGDVVSDINQTAGIGVRASIGSAGLQLTDITGKSAVPISVQDASTTGTTADLGFASGTLVGSTLIGTSLVRLNSGTNLNLLNDGNGVRRATNAADFTVNLKDGSQVSVSLANASTVQDVLNAINQATGASGKLDATLSGDGQSFVLTDTTGGAGTLSVAAVNASDAAKDLGILGTEQGSGVLTGGAVLAKPGSVLLKDLNGGSGAGTPGILSLTDRSGATATVDLSAATSLSDVVAGINGAGIGLQASINSAGDGIQVVDTTGHTNSNLIIADSTGTLAANLHLATNSATASVNSGDLNRKYVSENTLLSSLNLGQGVAAGEIRVTDSTGGSQIIDLSHATTVGDVLNALNTSGLQIHATINGTGDGILLTDTGSGSGSLSVIEQGGTTAADLHLLGSSQTSIDGALRATVTLQAGDTLQDLLNKVAASSAPVNATVVNDGSSAPLRLLLTSNQSGAAGNLLIDTGTTGVNLSTLATGTDARLALDGGSNSNPLVFSSSSNTFQQVAPGLTITANAVSSAPVAVSIGQDAQPLIDTLNNFITNFNSASDQLTKLTQYDPTSQTSGVLHNDSVMLQIENSFFAFIGGSFGTQPPGSIKNLADLGITLSAGHLSLDQNALTKQLTSNADGVKSFFSTTTTGFADKLSNQFDSYTQQSTGIIAQDMTGVDNDITDLNTRITQQNSYLADKRAQLEAQFTAMEQALAKLQEQQTALQSLFNLASPSTSTNASTNSTGGSLFGNSSNAGASSSVASSSGTSSGSSSGTTSTTGA